MQSLVSSPLSLLPLTLSLDISDLSRSYRRGHGRPPDRPLRSQGDRRGALHPPGDRCRALHPPGDPGRALRSL